MLRRTIFVLAASAVVGIASLATVSTDALAAKKKAVAPVAAAATAPAPLVLTSNGPVAQGIPKCFDIIVNYNSGPPCY